MKISESNKILIFLPLGLLALIIIIVKFNLLEPNKLNENYRYTIAETTAIGVDAEGAFFCDVKYKVQGKEYSSSFMFSMEDRSKYQVGDKYFIKYFPVDPDNAKIDFEVVVPKSMQQVPADGWKEIPAQ